VTSLYKRPGIRASLWLAYDKKEFLFRIRPDVFPQGFLTHDEIELWNLFYAKEIKDK